MIKAVFFDIDGTLLNNNENVMESTKLAIKSLQSKGIICGVATGRGPVLLNNYLEDVTFDLYVTYNGQYVFNKEEIIYQKAISETMIHDLAEFSDQHQRQILFGGSHRVDGSSLMLMGQKVWLKRIAKFLPKRFPIRGFKKMMQYMSRNKQKQRYLNMTILQEPIYQCVMLSAESETQRLQNLFPDCAFTRSNPYTVDIISKSGSKISGIEKAGLYYDFSLAEVMAFGDSWNDTEMIASVGIGIAMGNAMSEIKEVADYVTADHNHDGINQALKYYQLIE